MLCAIYGRRYLDSRLSDTMTSHDALGPCMQKPLHTCSAVETILAIPLVMRFPALIGVYETRLRRGVAVFSLALTLGHRRCIFALSSLTDTGASVFSS